MCTLHCLMYSSPSYINQPSPRVPTTTSPIVLQPLPSSGPHSHPQTHCHASLITPFVLLASSFLCLVLLSPLIFQFILSSPSSFTGLLQPMVPCQEKIVSFKGQQIAADLSLDHLKSGDHSRSNNQSYPVIQ